MAAFFAVYFVVAGVCIALGVKDLFFDTEWAAPCDDCRL